MLLALAVFGGVWAFALIAAAATPAATTRESVQDGTADGQSNRHSFQPSISGEGRYVAFTSFADNLTGDASTQFADVFRRDRLNQRTELVSLTPGGGRFNGHAGAPSISADGNRVAFQAVSAPQPSRTQAQARYQQLVFIEPRGERNGAVMVLEPDGTVRQVTTDGDAHPAVSPDGTKVAVENNGRIWIVDLATGERRQLTDPSIDAEPQQDRTDHTPGWSPDGTRVTFFSIMPALGEWAIHVMDVDDDDGPRPITTASAPAEGSWDNDDFLGFPDWSPDGTWIVFSAPSEEEPSTISLWMVNVFNNNASQVTFEADVHDTAPDWSPFGVDVAFERRFPDGETQIFLVQSMEGDEDQLTFSVGPNRHPSYNPAGSFIAFEGAVEAPAPPSPSPDPGATEAPSEPPGEPERGLFRVNQFSLSVQPILPGTGIMPEYVNWMVGNAFVDSGDGTMQVTKMSITDYARVLDTTESGVPTGRVRFFLCDEDSDNECTSGGTRIGPPHDVTPVAGSTAEAETESHPTTYPLSIAFTTSGDYCWRAEYSGSGQNGASLDTQASRQCVFVTKDALDDFFAEQISGPEPNQIVNNAFVIPPGGLVPGGYATFFICGPDEIDGSGCSSGGTRVGDPVPMNFTNNASSEPLDIPAGPAGLYCWRVEFSGDDNFLPATFTNTNNQCFSVGLEQRSLNGVASLGGTHEPGTNSGTFTAHIDEPADDARVTFFLCGPSEVTSTGCPTGGQQIGDPAPVENEVSGGFFTVESESTDDTMEEGTYCWRAEYRGEGHTDVTFTVLECFRIEAPFPAPPETRTEIWVRDIAAGTTTLVTAGLDGQQSDGENFDPAISHDGRHVAFQSRATNLSEEDAYSDTSNIFVHDLGAGVTRLVSVHPECVDSGPILLAASECTTGNSFHPTISGDGRYVGFASYSRDLVAFWPNGDPFTEVENDVAQIFVRDMVEGHTTIESVSLEEEDDGDGDSTEPSISADGMRIAFASWADILISEDSNEHRDIFLRDRAQRTTMRISRAFDPAGDQPDDNSREPAISADGRSVAFASAATNLVPDDGNAGEICGDEICFETHDIFLYDTVTDFTDRVSVTSDGLEAQGSGEDSPESRRPAVSASARFIAFDSSAVNLVDNDTNDEFDVFVHDRIPILRVDPNPLDFGELPIGVSSPPLLLTITNGGNGPATITILQPEGAAAGDYTLPPADNGCLGATLFSGQSCTVRVVFTPTASGPRDAVLTMDPPASNGPVNLTGRGAPVTFPALALTPNPIDFGEVQIGTTEGPLVASGLSIGTAPVQITTVTLEGVDAGSFSIGGPGGDTCTSALLAVGAGCQVNVRFAPAREGPHTANLVVSSNAIGSPHSIELRGVGIQLDGLLDVTPNPVDFGVVEPETTSDPRVVTAVSVGDLPVQIATLTIGGPDAGAFSFSGSNTCTGALLNVGDGCQAVLRFTPAHEGAHQGTLTFTSDALGSPHVVVLRGGVGGDGPPPTQPPTPGPEGDVLLRVSPRPVDFGFGARRELGEQRTAVVRNVGERAVTVTRVAVTGEQNDDFVKVRRGDQCTGRTLQPTQTCRVRLQFAPQDFGVREAELRVEGGTGVAPATTILLGSAPQLTIDPPLGRPGFLPTINGEFFPPNRTFRIVWRPGLGTVTVRSNNRGTFETPMLVLKRDRVGQRRVSVQGLGFRVFDRYLVVPGSLQPPDFTNRS